MAKSVYLQTLVDKLKTGKYYIELIRYRKEKDVYRLTEGVSDYIIDVDLPPYTDRVRDDVSYLESIPLDDKRKMMKEYDTNLQEVELAIDEKINSLRKSLNKDDSDNKKDDYHHYDWFLSQNKESGDIYVMGQIIEEDVHVKSTYKPKKSKPKTLIKESVSKKLSTEVKRFKIKLTNLDSIKLKLK